jgi:acyl-homoserine lactone acylase PvdQ
MRRSYTLALILLAAVAALPPAALALPGDVARYILPPGNFGALPPALNSTDQLPLYDALTPLRGNVTMADIEQYFLPEDFNPIGTTQEIVTGRPGLQLIYDAWGIPHVYGQTRADVAFGAGWTTARDRGLLLQLGRGPARAAVADIPGIDAFSLVTSAQNYAPSPEIEQLVTEQRELIERTYGRKGREIIADAQAYADGINAYWASRGINQPTMTVNDVIAVTAFIGSIFGAGGGEEARNGELLAKMEQELGTGPGHAAWEDIMLADDPEAPTTTNEPFNYGPLTGGPVTGSVKIDPGSIEDFDPHVTTVATRPATAAPFRLRASNWLIVAPERSATGNSVAVMGPQLGYYYPEIVQQIHLEGPGIRAQGVGVPGLAMYILIGRTEDYAWSLTSAGHDVRDVFAERLCEPDGSAPTRDSDHYVYRNGCRPFEHVNAGVLAGQPIAFKRSVHGPVIGTATVGGAPYALARQRSTYGRDGLNLAALKDMTEGKAFSARRFFKIANQFGFTFNWGYVSRTQTAFFSSGRLPRRARGLDRRLPTLGIGQYDWRGFLSRRKHPQDETGPGGLLLNWNNRSAPGFMHGDDEPYGSAQRVELFDHYSNLVTLEQDVSVMNRAATEDVRSPVWPVISRVLASPGPAPSARDAQVVGIVDEWVSRDAPRLDADLDGKNDDAGTVILDTAWGRIATAVLQPVLGGVFGDVVSLRGLNSQSGHSYVDKDLRTLLGDPVIGPFHTRFCGAGVLADCRAALWAAIHDAADVLEAAQGSDPTAWRGNASRTGFAPGLIPDTMRTTNRPTFQQVLELVHP